VCVCVCTTDSIENATPSKSTKSRTSNLLVQIQVQPKSEFEFVPQDTKESEFLDSLDFRNVAFSVETVMYIYTYMAHLLWSEFMDG